MNINEVLLNFLDNGTKEPAKTSFWNFWNFWTTLNFLMRFSLLCSGEWALSLYIMCLYLQWGLFNYLIYLFIVFQLDELGRLVCNLCNFIPGGVICFFPSYDYEKLVYTHWDKTGVIGRLGVKKKVCSLGSLEDLELRIKFVFTWVIGRLGVKNKVCSLGSLGDLELRKRFVHWGHWETWSWETWS